VALGGGLMRGRAMLRGWKNMHPGEQYVDKYVRLYEHIDDPDYVSKTEAFSAWYENTIDLPGRWYLQAINELFKEADHSDVFAGCRALLFGAAEPLLARAQRAGAVRDDVDISDVLHLVSGIAKIATPDQAYKLRLLDVALDGLRRRPVDSA